jgi:phage FluMu gp28-like protein
MLSSILPYQFRLLTDPSPKIIVRKSRRTGFTWIQALRMVLAAMEGRHQNIISYREDASKLVIDDCQYWIDELVKSGLTKRKDWEQLKGIIRHLPTHTTIRALPCIPRVIRGRKGDVFIDEAAYIPQPMLIQILTAARPLATWGGKITLISSPFSPGTFSDLCNNPDWSLHTVTLHDAVEDGLYRVICQESGQPDPTPEDTDQWVQSLLRDAGVFAPQEYLCEDFQVGTSSWISPDTVLQPIPIVYPDSPEGYNFRIYNQVHSIGVDVGVSESPTVISFFGVDGLLQILEVRGWNLPQIEQLLDSLITDNTKTIAIDSNGIGRGLADSLADRYPQTRHTPNNAQWFSSVVIRFLSEVWSGTVGISSDPIVLSDLGNTTMDSGRLKLMPSTVNGNHRHCDSVPSMAMAYQFKPSTQDIHSIWE